MDKMIVLLGYMAILCVVSAAGAYLPQIKRMNDRQTHFLIALSGGIFLGLLFVMLVPEAYELSVEHEGRSFETVSYMFLFGFLLIAFVDVLIKHFHMAECPCECHEDEHKHEIASLSAFVGLSVHATCDGLALAAAILGGEHIGLVALIGMSVHKFVVLFSLSSSLLLTDKSAKGRWTYLGAFIAISPLSAILFYLFFNGFEIYDVAGLPMAFAAGTFMFVTFCNMLPEAFHRKDHELVSFIVIFAGVCVSVITVFLVNMLGGHTH
ncbi:MAG: ZIP family metal transporter [Candidatus Methanomethylophilaceae archaeon]|nr:ZIP family metal transporter [Candidatus Methanomethylophilaceae archaeon]MDY5872379.1 ZIP family metal transporter [Candidatus Methanomethylophilaceae archaeon]